MKYMMGSGLAGTSVIARLFCRGKRKKAKFIKINGAMHGRALGGFFETHISHPFQTVNGLTWPFYIRVIVRTIRMIHGERHRLFRTRGFSLRESVAPVPIAAVFKFGRSIDLVFYVLPVWMSAICSFLHGRSADRFYSITCHRDSPSGVIKKTILFP